jgi:hypothetical protein
VLLSRDGLPRPAMDMHRLSLQWPLRVGATAMRASNLCAAPAALAASLDFRSPPAARALFVVARAGGEPRRESGLLEARPLARFSDLSPFRLAVSSRSFSSKMATSLVHVNLPASGSRSVPWRAIACCGAKANRG